VIAWTTQSKIDGHVVRGIVPFGIGVAVVPTDTAVQGPPQGPVSGSPVEMALRWLILLAAAALVGSFGFWLLQADVSRRAAAAFPYKVSTGELRVAAFAWVAFLLS